MADMSDTSAEFMPFRPEEATQVMPGIPVWRPTSKSPFSPTAADYGESEISKRRDIIKAAAKDQDWETQTTRTTTPIEQEWRIAVWCAEPGRLDMFLPLVKMESAALEADPALLGPVPFKIARCILRRFGDVTRACKCISIDLRRCGGRTCPGISIDV